jgi:hypothetical protein
MFQQPSQGDQFKAAELVGSLVLIYVLELREDVTTSFGPADAIAADIHVLQGPGAGDSYKNTLIFQKALIGSLRGAIGGDPVLGRVGQGTAKPGQSAPYILHPYTDADAAVATAWIQANQKPFQAPATNGQAAGPPAVAAPSPAAATPATGNGLPNGMTAEAFAALPPEVQELLRQSAAAPTR